MAFESMLEALVFLVDREKVAGKSRETAIYLAMQSLTNCKAKERERIEQELRRKLQARDKAESLFNPKQLTFALGPK